MKNRVINFIGKAHYGVDLGTYIWGNNEAGKTELIATIDGYRSILKLCTNEDEANDFQDEIGRFIAEAINEKIERGFTRVDRIHVRDINMSVRLLNCLKLADFDYLDEVCQFTRFEISRFRKIGMKSLCELQEIMDKYKLKFKGE
jgi:DNA-directed RNA polymerase alpha subunit